MKLKEINRTAIQAWSPAQHHPIYLAAGTSAQQLDATFSTNASLEIFELDLAEPTLAMKSCGTFSSPHRYHKLVWGPEGTDEQGLPSGVLIAGGETGNIILYDPSKIIAGDSEVVIAQSDKHTGPVRSLSVNLFQTNLVASGGNESEIYIWDLNSFGSPMVPGPKSQPVEDISCVAWNCQVQHILASASPSGRASIWDLRKNDLIIKVSDHSNRMHCSGLAWNPEVATQLALASEDDRMPVIQMWDLRFATSPLKVLENHTRGVLAIAWSLADPELLLSCGKDNRILCWNPNTAEVLYELPTSSQWCFDIQWCPRNPAVLSAASFDGRISIYSIMGGSNDVANSAQADQISSSFGNMDPFGTGQTLPPLQLPQPTSTNSTITPLKKPPKWIRRPVGASFAFGGKLVSWENIKPPPQQPQQPVPHVVHVSQVVTETDFLDRSNQLQATLTAGTFVEFCQKKIEDAENEFEKTVWAFLKVHFEDDTRGKYLELLGYKKEELALKIASALEGKDHKSDENIEDVSMFTPPTVAQQPVPEVALTPTVDLDTTPPINLVPPVNGEPEPELELSAVHLDEEKPRNVALNADTSEEEAALEEVEKNGPVVEEEGPELEEIPVVEEEPVADQIPVLEETPSPSSETVKASQDVDRLITQALLIGDFEAAVNLCLHDNRMADSIILAIAGGPELLEKTQKKYLAKTQSKIGKLISAVVMKDWLDILETCDLHNWKEALAAVMTYAKPEEFSSLCGLLGTRLEAAEDLPLQAQACLCYICAGSMEQLVSCWSKAQDSSSPLSLQDLVEKVVVLRQAVEKAQGGVAPAVGAMLAEKMSQYASLLASQGSLQTAISYLPTNTEQVAVQLLRERLSRALGQYAAAPAASTVPLQNRQPAVPAAIPPQAYAPVQPQPQPQQLPPQPTPTAPTQQYYQQAEPVPGPFGPQSPVNAGPTAPGAFMYSQQYQRPQNGWNDPPALSRVPKKKKVPEHYTPPAPITAPIMAPLGDPQQVAPMQPPQQQQQQQQQLPGQPAGVPAPFTPIQQQPLGPAVRNPAMPNMTVEGAPGAPTGDVIQPMQSLPAEKIMKKPIPDEHLILKTTFEGLIQKCLAAATDPQTKRKLDDANKRLEFLYDKLREQTLSPAIVTGLHNMARSIESRSYTDGLNIHTHIVSNSNFSETSAFMPVLKVVLTQANKLGV
ncbi:protein transport protein Sec31A isoform X8 [Colossoma macropomum]|uniref:protein transport protein Sec31A isoform X8 n=1 Tax=Colossoma macropomum TaxID=42526 RepID=UPI001863D1E1|nr:protein transport protein Sec31A isoform X8 [Colossoma macropomum]